MNRSRNDIEHYPQVIVGAGYVGCLLALLLQRAGQKVLLIEKSPNNSIHDDRHFGIAKETRWVLQDLGLWHELAKASTDIQAMQIFMADAQESPWLTLQNTEQTIPIGRMIPAALLQQTLREALYDAGVDVRYATSVVDIVEQDARAKVQTSDGQEFSTDLVIAADGMASATRKMVGIGTMDKPFGQQAQQWKIVHDAPHDQIAFENLLPEGPFVVLPTQDAHTSKLVWCCDAGREVGDETAIRAHFPIALGEISLLEYIGSYPLVQQQAERAYRGRVVLVGDAYQRVHPVAAQGLNLGLRDAATLAKVLIEAEYLGLDRGAPSVLAAYSSNRQWDRYWVRTLTYLLGKKSGWDTPMMARPKKILGRVMRSAPAKRLVRKAFHGE